MSVRETILAALRQAAPVTAPLPDAPAATVYFNPAKQFADTLAAVGGRAAYIQSTEDLAKELRQLEVCRQAERIASLVDGIESVNVELDGIEDPHVLEGIDVAVLPGEFAVAENAAVWLSGSKLGRLRALFVVAQHLILVVPAERIVHNMQEAYDQISFDGLGFGVFISGPSKTADIEQSLVIGAHGARSCTVFLVGSR